MDSLPLKPETAARLHEPARARGYDPVEAVNTALAAWLADEQDEYEGACRAIERGQADIEAGRTRAAGAALRDLERKHDIPG